jgi:hypothetical protein
MKKISPDSIKRNISRSLVPTRTDKISGVIISTSATHRGQKSMTVFGRRFTTMVSSDSKTNAAFCSIKNLLPYGVWG